MSNYKLLSCVWEITLGCNLNCIHCGSTAGKKRENELTTKEAVDLCYDLKKSGCQSVALMGGEPFLRADFWEISYKIKELGMDLCIITNGTIYSDEMFKKLKLLDLEAIATSIDGAKEGTHDRIRGVDGAYKKTLNFIEKALSYELPLSIITTVSKINISELNDIKEMIKGKKIAWQIQVAGAEGERFNRKYLLDEEDFYSVGLFIEGIRRNYSIKELPVIGAHDMGYNSFVINNIWLYEKWYGCQAGISVVGIRSNGDVLGCLSINNDKYVEGNVREKSIYEIWNDENSFAYTRKFKKEDAGPNCYNCKYIDDCKGGCSEMSLSKTGILHNDPYCFYKMETRNMSFLKRWHLSIISKIYKKKDISGLRNIFLGVRK